MDGVTWAFRIAGTSLDEVDLVLLQAGVEPAGLSQEGEVCTVWFDERRDLGPTGLDGTWEAVERADWAERWKEGIERITVGALTVVPPWLATPADHDDPLTLVIEPGMAFGTGHHETTIGCLAALQEVSIRGRRVVDVGTGTAVLALAARALGAAQCVGVDTDPEATAVARSNVAAHGGGVDVRDGSTEVAGGRADVVVANLITHTILALLDDLVGLLRPDGTLILSGIGVDRTDVVADAAAARGLAVTARRGREWSVLIARPAGADRKSVQGPGKPGP